MQLSASRPWRALAALFPLLLCAFLFLQSPALAGERLYQVSTINALMAGLFQGAVTLDELTSHGDTGLGTFAGLDGEMIVLDSTVYQVRVDGSVHVMGPQETTPFAAVTSFAPDATVQLSSVADMNDLHAQLHAALPNPNAIYAIRITGTFSHVQARSVPPSQPPYPGLAEVAKHQAVFDLGDLDGTVVGLYCPDYLAKLNVAGFHLHILSADATRGGHLLQIAGQNLTAQLDHLGELTLVLPDTPSAASADLGQDTSGQLRAIESAPGK